MARHLVIAIALAVSTTPLLSRAAAAPQPPNPPSGIYRIQQRVADGVVLVQRTLYLAFDNDKVTGYYDNPYPRPVETDVDQTCRFFLSGKLTTPDTIELSAQHPDDQFVAGVSLKLRPDGAWTVTVNGVTGNRSYLPNCPVPSLLSGDVVKLGDTRPWRMVGYVSKPRAVLHTDATDSSATTAYLVNHDPVAIQSLQGDWLQVVYLARDHELVRWLRSADVYYHLEH